MIRLQSVVCFQQKALSISKIQYGGQLRISSQNSLKFCTYAGRDIEPLILGDEQKTSKQWRLQ